MEEYSNPGKPTSPSVLHFGHSLTNVENEIDIDHDLYAGLIRLHVLHHAVHEPIFGLGMIEELAATAIASAPAACIRCCTAWSARDICARPPQRNGRSLRKVYRATPQGRKALAAIKDKVRELFQELIEGK